ncbi:uncharacterized protein LOC129906599 [Episyrphus balteatus]|uniref:uncharacterized protein LOC129906599 n=1 Tax=Episyrphus balteatus TaxID=286459 RepID=UPI0024856E2A|nr:uncharacterized protein LOC129906599 [Episyrphus balteatus]
MASKYLFVVAIAFSLLAFVICIPKAATPASVTATEDEDPKQLFFGAQGKETSTPDFVRLVVMRIIYGIASTMGAEERLAEIFNGAFVPPGEDDGDYGLDFGGIDGIFEDR